MEKPGRPVRSALFVPGHRASWIEKASQYGADRLILDLEDSVPPVEKPGARRITRDSLRLLRQQGQRAGVRINSLATGLAQADIEAVVCRELEYVILSKVETAADLHHLDRELAELERKHGLDHGHIETPLLAETARAMRDIYEIATSCHRVRRVILAAGPGGDAARAIGYQWSKEGTETLYLRSKAVLDCRAAGIRYPEITSWWNVADLEGLEKDARRNRQLGFRGQTVMHPSHVAIVNKVFTPSAEEVAYAQGLVAAMDDAARQGIAAIAYEGEMVDEAMANYARELLAFSKSLETGE
ncbi:MAG TPA: CoA ester lyase [Bryobacteraceae bacterium]|nr:CoA ester lyase [Bryobacteraceae bacterium]